MLKPIPLALVALLTLSTASLAQLSNAPGAPDYIRTAIANAGENRSEISRAWFATPPHQKPGMAFLLEHMPEHDLRSLTSDFLLENVSLAYVAWRTAPWYDRISEELFLNEILPYCLVTEERVAWRTTLREKCLDLIADAETPAEAVVRLNQELFPEFGVIYSTERSRTDQNVRQVLEEQKATCTGLSVLLTSACRSVGVPARLAGTPLWADSSGNHSWVEIWDDGWSFTGAAEPAEDRLNDAWFTERASRARKDVPMHAVYATSYARTGTVFPMIWNESVQYVSGVNVTDRYTTVRDGLVTGTAVRFVAFDQDLRRAPTRLEVRDTKGRTVFSGTTRTDRADLNDHLTAMLDAGIGYEAIAHTPTGRRTLAFRTPTDGEAMVLRISVRSSHGWGRVR